MAAASSDDHLMCFILLLLAFGPRAMLFLTWIFSSVVEQAYDNFLVPVLGFFLMPWTTLSYAVLWSADGLSTLDWIVVAVGFLADVGSYGASARTRIG